MRDYASSQHAVPCVPCGGPGAGYVRTSAELGAPLSKSRTAGGSPQGPCILQDPVRGILRFPIMLGQAMYIDLLEPLVIAAITERQEYQLMPPMS